MKKVFIFGLSIFLTLVMAGGIFVALALNSVTAPGPLAEDKLILIERGTGVSAIADQLAREGIISSSFLLKVKVKLDADPRPLKAGEYEFPASVSMADALEKIRAGEVYDRKVTFPEGVTSWQIVEILKKQEDLSGEITEIPEEGTLLPETYHYVKNEDRNAILGHMRAAMDKAVADLWPNRSEGLPITSKAEAMVLASIVEKETGVADERKKVAGVFINRLKRGMPMQSDPTVIYGMTKGEIQNEGQGPIGRRLLTKDLQRPNPYNTYTNPGLPPGPIANPGRASIEAVLHPEEHDYVYFVADGTGGHVFARTLSEHNSNVARWRKIRKAQ